MIANNRYDVAILGGGLAGLTLAKQLLMKRSETRVAVIEKRTFPVAESTHKVGESTVEIGAHYFGEQLQLKKHLTDEQLPKFGLRFSSRTSTKVWMKARKWAVANLLPRPAIRSIADDLRTIWRGRSPTWGRSSLAGHDCEM